MGRMGRRGRADRPIDASALRLPRRLAGVDDLLAGVIASRGVDDSLAGVIASRGVDDSLAGVLDSLGG